MLQLLREAKEVFLMPIGISKVVQLSRMMNCA